MRVLTGVKLFFFMVLLIMLTANPLYQFVYKPRMAERMIGRGVAEIEKAVRNPADRERLFDAAEAVFGTVEKDFVVNSTEHFNRYGMAYLKASEYGRAFGKFARSLAVRKDDSGTLRNLGAFFARVPDESFKKMNIGALSGAVGFPASLSLKTKGDHALFFYCKSLTVGSGNEESIKGIGDLLSGR